MKKFAPYFALLKEVKVQFIMALVCGVIYGVAGGFGFPFMAYKVFPVVFGESKPSLMLLTGVVALLPIVFLLRGVSGFLNTYLMAHCGVHILVRVREQLFAKIQSLPLGFFHRHKTGDIMSRMLGDSSNLQTMVTTVSNDIIKQPITLIGAIGALIFLALQKTEVIFILFALAIIPVCGFPVWFIGRKLLRRAKKVRDRTGNLSAVMNENLSAVNEIRAYNLQGRETKRFESLIHGLARAFMRVVKYKHIQTPIIELISALGVSIAIVYAVHRDLNLEDVVPLMTALYMTYEPIKRMGAIHTRLKQGEASLDRILYMLNSVDKIPDPKEPHSLTRVNGAIAFEHLTFSYDTAAVLHDVNVQIDAGQIVALVGPSGAGKSTFANLIPRFYDAEEGRITLDGIDVRDLTKHDLRTHISVVPQDPVLFNDTVRNNIRIGRLDASDKEVEAAARHAFAHLFVEELEDGYETVVGERGVRLSGGQKQRIAIARAFLKAAPILILDEATSALDSESEEMVHKALEELVEGKTVIMIAHRFSTIRMAHRILLFEDGRLTAQGPHDQVYKESQTYRNLFDKQSDSLNDF